MKHAKCFAVGNMHPVVQLETEYLSYIKEKIVCHLRRERLLGK